MITPKTHRIVESPSCIICGEIIETACIEDYFYLPLGVAVPFFHHSCVHRRYTNTQFYEKIRFHIENIGFKLFAMRRAIEQGEDDAPYYLTLMNIDSDFQILREKFEDILMKAKKERKRSRDVEILKEILDCIRLIILEKDRFFDVFNLKLIISEEDCLK